MENFLISSLLAITGLLSISIGFLIFRVLLPVLNYISGFAVAFCILTAMHNTVSVTYTATIIFANIVGLSLGIFSYYQYKKATVILASSLSAFLFIIISHSLGLIDEKSIIVLLTLSGALIGGLVVDKKGINKSTLIILSALFGALAIFVASLLIFADTSLSAVFSEGLFKTIETNFSYTWRWLFGLIGGTILGSVIQRRVLANITDKSRGRFLINNNQRET